MRVGIFSDTWYPEMNGVAVSAKQLKTELERLGCEVFVFTVDGGEDVDRSHVFRMKTIPAGVVRDRRVGILNYRKWLRFIGHLDLDVIHTQTEFSLGILGKRAARRYRIPMVHTFHTIYEYDIHFLRLPGKDLRAMHSLVKRICRGWCNMADHVIVPTEKVKELLEEYGVRRDIDIIPTGLPLSKFRNVDTEHVRKLREQYGLTDDHKVLIYLGRVSKEKEIDVILDYMVKVREKDPDVRLVIVGDGVARVDLMMQAKRSGLEDRVIFTGRAPWEEIQDYYALGDIFVSASHSETQGMTYYESLFTGLPVLAVKDPCLDPIIREGVNGYQVEGADDFIEKMEDIFGRLEEFSRNAALSAEPFSSERFAEKVLDTYMETIDNFRS